MSISEALRVAGHLKPAEQELVQQAYECAVSAHAGQQRLTGEAYVEHPLEVANILSGLRLDAPTVIAALLHDTVEDTDLTLADVRKRFGSEVARLVEGVTKLSRISFRTDQELHAENIRKMLLA
ncbi:MAG: HD domain-containing protein, partial [Candidatus Dormibacteraceae bacterium]